MVKTSYQIIIIIVASVAFGVFSNLLNPHKIQWTGPVGDVDNLTVKVIDGKNPGVNDQSGEDITLPCFDPDNIAVHELSLEKVREIFDLKKAIFIDARYPASYKAGRIVGAVNLPSDEFDKYYPMVADKIGIDDPLMIYCSSPACDQGILLAQMLCDLGHAKVMLFKEGFYAWRDAGLPTEKGKAH